MNTNNTRFLRTANRYIVLMAILEHSTLTIEEIIRITNLSRPTILEILKALIADGLVTKSGKAAAAVGRQPVTYCINNNHLFAMGIDTDFPETHLAISNLSGEMIFSCSKHIPIDTPADGIVTKLVELIEYAIAEAGIPRDDIIGLGLGAPAMVNVPQNLAVRISKVPSWQNIDIAAYIQEKTGIYTTVHNDAHVLGLIERKYRNLQNESFLYITHRSGVGSAIFINGELYDGSFGNSGYLGHICIDLNGPRCECGNTGCLELYCSRRAIVNNYNQKAHDAGLPMFFDCDQIFAASAEGNELATEVLQDAGRVLGIGIANLIMLYDINHVILGWVKDKNTPFFRSLVEAIKIRHQAFLDVSDVTVELGMSDEINSGLAGCYYVLNQFFQAPTIQLNP